MSEFEESFRFILKNEGGYVNNKKDPGGETNYGISLKFLRSFGNEFDFNRNGILSDDIQRLTINQARLIYFEKFWKLFDFYRINDQRICNYIFDMCISMGPATSIMCVQRALHSVDSKNRILVEDGKMGKKTIFAINEAVSKMFDAFGCCLKAIRVEHYRCLIKSNPNLEVFRNGWFERAYNL